MKYLMTALMMLYCFSIYAQRIDSNWNTKLDASIAQFRACENTTAAGVNSCNKYIGKTLQALYQLNDFYSKENGRYMLASEMYDYLQQSSRWVYLGKGYEQEALTKAQQRANEKKAVVAVYRNASGEGHLAYILPGELLASGTWKLQVPNSAAYFVDKPSHSYNNKALSYSFPRNAMPLVILYARK